MDYALKKKEEREHARKRRKRSTYSSLSFPPSLSGAAVGPVNPLTTSCFWNGLHIKGRIKKAKCLEHVKKNRKKCSIPFFYSLYDTVLKKALHPDLDTHPCVWYGWLAEERRERSNCPERKENGDEYAIPIRTQDVDAPTSVCFFLPRVCPALTHSLRKFFPELKGIPSCLSSACQNFRFTSSPFPSPAASVKSSSGEK